MSLEYIRSTYNVPAKRGGRIRYTDSQGVIFNCTIKSARGGLLRVLVDDRVPGYRGRLLLHPTWHVEYIAHGVPVTSPAYDAMLVALEHVASGKSGYLNKVKAAIAIAKAAQAAPGVSAPDGQVKPEQAP